MLLDSRAVVILVKYSIFIMFSRLDEACDPQSLNANSSPQVTELPPENSPETPMSPGSGSTCTEEQHKSTTESQQNSPHAIILCNETSPLPTQSFPETHSPPPQTILKTPPIILDVINIPVVPLLPPESTLKTALLSSLNVAASATPQKLSQSLPTTCQHPAYGLSKSPPNVAQSSSRLPHRTQNATQSVSNTQANTFTSPTNVSQTFTLNASELPSVSAQNLVNSPPSPPLSPSHPEPFLLNSVTFTSSVTSHLSSPICSSSSALHSPDTLGPPIGLLPMMPSVTPQLVTPPQTITPPPLELTPPPAQQLGSDDEEQEDPSDYCKGETLFPESCKITKFTQKHCGFNPSTLIP